MGITQQTRREAYRRIQPHISVMQLNALRWLSKLGKATAEGVKIACGAKSHNNIAPRLCELCGMGYVKTDGTMINTTGRPAAAYTLTDDGKKYLEEVPEDDR